MEKELPEISSAPSTNEGKKEEQGKPSKVKVMEEQDGPTESIVPGTQEASAKTKGKKYIYLLNSLSAMTSYRRSNQK